MDPLVDPGLPLVGAIGNWAEWLAIENTPEELDAVRTATARDAEKLLSANWSSIGAGQ
jgi:hypothetical protein